MSYVQAAENGCTSKPVEDPKLAPVQSVPAMILAAPSPLRDTAKRGAPPLAEQSEMEDLRALCRRLQADCKLGEEKRREAEQRQSELERELAAARADSAARGQKGSTADIKGPAGSEQMPESPGLAKLHAEAKQACAETAAFWRALEAEVASPVLRALRKQDASARAAAEAKVERKTRNALWEVLQSQVDRPTIVAVAQAIGGARDKEPALPVHVARRLFEERKMGPDANEQGGASTTAASGPRLQKTARTRTASMPTMRETSGTRQNSGRSQTRTELTQEHGRGTEVATPTSSKVRDRVREFELCGSRR